MNDQFLDEIAAQVCRAADTLLAAAKLKPGQLLVLGASTSEVAGAAIGTGSSQQIGDLIIHTLVDRLQPLGIVLAVGCCEHLNRAIVLPREAAEQYRLTPVCVRPVLHAGGACGTAYYDLLPEPVMVESIAAHAGMDIGDALIGMHLMPVAVPVRGDIDHIGHAHLTMARTRPRYVGGPRAQYPEL